MLIIGERGTGKELVATRLHYLSPRWEEPLVKLNCSALTESLLDSELFGHEAGSFTGAQKRHIGRFERAAGGTLLLDELATIPPRMQEKILRVIEYGEFERVGGSETVQVDVRILGATNADLPAIWHSRESFGPTCWIASRSTSLISRHCGIAAKTSCRWPNISRSTSFANSAGNFFPASPMRAVKSCWPPAGQVTCAA